jgi:hypothetical protein
MKKLEIPVKIDQEFVDDWKITGEDCKCKQMNSFFQTFLFVSKTVQFVTRAI